MMNDIAIPQRDWPTFCEQFTRQHQGWLVGLRQLRTDDLASDKRGAEQSLGLFTGSRRLHEVREGEQDDRVEIMVTVRDGNDDTSFLVEDAIALYSRRSGDAHQGLRIDSGNGTSTLIEFRAAAEPESLDGLADFEH